MRALIKWPGGKAREYKNIKGIIPKDTKTYIEPFFGGGGIYFNLEPKKSIINDINENLMTFYRFLKEENKEFRKALDQIADDWDNLSIIAKAVGISFNITCPAKGAFRLKRKNLWRRSVSSKRQAQSFFCFVAKII